MEDNWERQRERENREWLEKYPLEHWIECVGPGWSHLVEQAYNITVASGSIPMQVKEKFGGLRFYTGSAPAGKGDAMWDAISALEHESYKICEYCGRPGKTRPTGWIKTLCWRHHMQWHVRRRKSIFKSKIKRRVRWLRR